MKCVQAVRSSRDAVAEGPRTPHSPKRRRHRVSGDKDTQSPLRGRPGPRGRAADVSAASSAFHKIPHCCAITGQQAARIAATPGQRVARCKVV